MSPEDQLCINTIRCLGAALPEKAKSGHPGAPMGCAPMAHALFSGLMQFCPTAPKWIARDRFVLSNGHACALLYTMLHLCGYDLPLDELKRFRQICSRTPGHPEFGHTAGVEVTSGPLGQGVSQAVGLAIATEMMVAKYNKPDIALFDNFVFAIVGDGCLQEGVSSESCSLAGHLRLNRLIVLYDENQISIDGNTDLSFTENVGARYRAYGWDVLNIEDGDNNYGAIVASIEFAKQRRLDQPTLIMCRTTIGFGSLKEGSEKVHGAPLGPDDLKQVREKFGFSAEDDIFSIPEEVTKYYAGRKVECIEKWNEWNQMYEQYQTKYPDEFAELERRFSPYDTNAKLPSFSPESKADSTRSLSGQCLNALADQYPWIVGGSADLTVSNCTSLKNTKDFTFEDRLGRYIRFGVREHGMCAITNGIFAFGGFKPFAATFLNFLTYGWGAVRISALSKFGVLYIATHDSIELGEDGPTHQPIEVAALCRATPNMIFFRPADGTEVAAGYEVWMEHEHTPTVMALCRSAVPQLKSSIEGAKRGAYILKEFTRNGKPRLILGGSGSEVSLCIGVAEKLEANGTHDVRVVSMPSWELFRKQSEEYQHSVIDPMDNSLYVEAANTLGCQRWWKKSHGMTTFGASAPKTQVFAHFKFTVDGIIQTIMSEFSHQ